jgi:hypothetical protein
MLIAAVCWRNTASEAKSISSSCECRICCYLVVLVAEVRGCYVGGYPSGTPLACIRVHFLCSGALCVDLDCCLRSMFSRTAVRWV